MGIKAINCCLLQVFMHIESPELRLMDTDALYLLLEKVSAGKTSREAAARHFYGNRKHIAQLIGFVFEVEDPVSVKASWVLDMVASDDIAIILPGLDHFTKNIHRVCNESALRPLARICERLLAAMDADQPSLAGIKLSGLQHELLLNAAFKWLIGPHKVATKVFAMRCLYYLGKEAPWVHGELREILREQYARETSGYKARARDTLQKLEAFGRSRML